jgi:MoaA/NifB/PqqE/SkfB family radical SAM enzyme
LETPELATEQWKSIISQLADLGCRRVTLLGGEPLIRPDVADLIRHAREKGMSCLLSTNGLLVPEKINELKDLSAIVLSLDAAGPANDEVRGEGVFEAAKEAVAAAKDAGIPIKINSVLSANSAPHLESFLEFLEDYDLSVTFNVVRSGNSNLWYKAASLRDSDEEIKTLLEKLSYLAKRNHRILFSSLIYKYGSFWKDYSKDRYEKGELSEKDPILQKGPHCQAGRYFMNIGPDGSVYPCVVTTGEISGGNAVSDGVEECWKALHDHSCEACYTPCLVEINYLFSLHPKVLLHFLQRQFKLFA